MATINHKQGVTRRGFLGLSSAALATAGLFVEANTAGDAAASENTIKPDSFSVTGKIALEEHFALPESAGTDYGVSLRDLPTPDLRDKIMEIGSGRIADMDRGGLDICILSLVSPGIQVIPGVLQAVALAQRE